MRNYPRSSHNQWIPKIYSISFNNRSISPEILLFTFTNTIYLWNKKMPILFLFQKRSKITFRLTSFIIILNHAISISVNFRKFCRITPIFYFIFHWYFRNRRFRDFFHFFTYWRSKEKWLLLLVMSLAFAFGNKNNNFLISDCNIQFSWVIFRCSH